MCGIFGSPTLTPSVRAMLPYLGIEMQTRGKDAWGASDGVDVIKKVGPIIDSWAEFKDDIHHWRSGIFHTRGASTGTPKEEANAHPFVYHKADGTSVIGIHNGFITNHEDLDTKYGRDFDVDSQHIWAHRAAGLPWTDIRGWGNLAWWETEPGAERRMHLLRFNTNSLHVARLRAGEYIFCSEVKPISTIATMLGNPPEVWYPIDEYHHYWFTRDPAVPRGVTLHKGELVAFPKPNTGPVVVYSGFHGGGPNAHRGAWDKNNTYCFKCNAMRVNGDSEVLCWSCLRDAIGDYQAAGEEIWRQ